MSRAPSQKLDAVRRLLLEEGLPVSAVAPHPDVQLSVRRVYDFVRKHNFPVNRPLIPHSGREHQFLRALAVFPREVVQRAFSLSPAAIDRELARIREEQSCPGG
jgi:hypothetical protein